MSQEQDKPLEELRVVLVDDHAMFRTEVPWRRTWVSWCHDWGMEQTDGAILALLSRDGRMSFTELGREVGLSTSAAQQRVRRLE